MKELNNYFVPFVTFHVNKLLLNSNDSKVEKLKFIPSNKFKLTIIKTKKMFHEPSKYMDIFSVSLLHNLLFIKDRGKKIFHFSHF
jgi:hypothetical protein